MLRDTILGWRRSQMTLTSPEHTTKVLSVYFIIILSYFANESRETNTFHHLTTNFLSLLLRNWIISRPVRHMCKTYCRWYESCLKDQWCKKRSNEDLCKKSKVTPLANVFTESQLRSAAHLGSSNVKPSVLLLLNRLKHWHAFAHLKVCVKSGIPCYWLFLVCSSASIGHIRHSSATFDNYQAKHHQ